MDMPRSTPPAVCERTISSPGSSMSDSRYDVPCDLDVEHVELAIARPQPAVGIDVHRGVRELLPARDALEDRPGDEVDRRAPAPSAAPIRSRVPSSVSAAAACSSSEPIAVHFSGSTISLAPSAAAARVRRSALARFTAGSAVELSCTAATLTGASSPTAGTPTASPTSRPRNRLTGQSTSSSITPAAAATAPMMVAPPARMRLFRGGRPLKRWRYVGVFSEELMACAALVQLGPARQILLGGPLARRRAAARAHAPVPRRGTVRALRRGPHGGARPTASSSI